MFGALTHSKEVNPMMGAARVRADEKLSADRGVLGARKQRMAGCVEPWSLGSRLTDDL